MRLMPFGANDSQYSSEQSPSTPTDTSTQTPQFSSESQVQIEEVEVITKSKVETQWSKQEDTILLAWLNPSYNAYVGNNQKGSQFWSRISKYFQELKKHK